MDPGLFYLILLFICLHISYTVCFFAEYLKGMYFIIYESRYSLHTVSCF